MTTTATVPGGPVDESFDPLSPEFLADPYATLASRPGQGSPVFFAPSIGYYVVTSYAAIDAVFRDPAAYSAAVAQAPLAPIVPEAQQILLAGGYKPQPSMVSLDEPEHARLRKPAARAFSMKRVTAMIPTIEATTAGRDEAAFDRPGEFDAHRTDAERHLAFGKGLHYCLGANLGKLEAKIAVAELARRYPRLRLAPDQDFTCHPNISFRGPQVLMVRSQQ